MIGIRQRATTSKQASKDGCSLEQSAFCVQRWYSTFSSFLPPFFSSSSLHLTRPFYLYAHCRTHFLTNIMFNPLFILSTGVLENLRFELTSHPELLHSRAEGGFSCFHILVGEANGKREHQDCLAYVSISSLCFFSFFPLALLSSVLVRLLSLEFGFSFELCLPARRASLPSIDLCLLTPALLSSLLPSLYPISHNPSWHSYADIC